MCLIAIKISVPLKSASSGGVGINVFLQLLSAPLSETGIEYN